MGINAEYMGTPVHFLPLVAHIFSKAMKTACVLFLLACLTALVVSESRFRKLEKEEHRLGCSILEITKCQKEIETAFEDCSHISDMVSIQTCINDILAMTDCQKCICDVLPIC